MKFKMICACGGKTADKPWSCYPEAWQGAMEFKDGQAYIDASLVTSLTGMVADCKRAAKEKGKVFSGLLLPPEAPEGWTIVLCDE